MNTIKALIKLCLFIAILLTYFVVATILYFSTLSLKTRRSRLINNTQRYTRLLAFIFRVKVICKNPISPDETSLVIGNHVGFIDVIAMQTIQPCVFITSLEMKHTPVLGQISQLAGCAYVNRLNRSNIEDELQDIVKALKEGFRVGLYPEAQASNGEQVLPFKKTLLMAAGYANCPIRPYVFNYLKVNGRPVEYKDRDYVCWYGDQSFFPSMWKTFHLDSVECEIEFLEPFYFKQEDDRTFVSVTVHDRIAAKFRPFVRPKE